MKDSRLKLLIEPPALSADAGVSHALNLLLIAVTRSNPAVGALLDEFTALHAQYIAQLRAQAAEGEQSSALIENFSTAAKQVYMRLSALENQQTEAKRAEQDAPETSLRVH